MLARMKVEGPRGVASTNGARRASATAAPGFAPAAEAPARVAASTGVGAATPLDAIIALQAEETPQHRRARQTKRGHDALNALERLEEGLLLGRAPVALRRELELLQRAAQLTGEPGLDDTLREIDTRLAVELAKLERLAGSA